MERPGAQRPTLKLWLAGSKWRPPAQSHLAPALGPAAPIGSGQWRQAGRARPSLAPVQQVNRFGRPPAPGMRPNRWPHTPTGAPVGPSAATHLKSATTPSASGHCWRRSCVLANVLGAPELSLRPGRANTTTGSELLVSSWLASLGVCAGPLLLRRAPGSSLSRQRSW